MQTIQQFPSWFSKQKFSGKIIIGCISLLMLCCCCSGFSAILSPPHSTPTVLSAQNNSLAATVDISAIKTMAVETAFANINQAQTVSVSTETPNSISASTNSTVTRTPKPTKKITPTKTSTFTSNVASTESIESTSTVIGGSYPPGITAVCADGTYSYSQHRRGTCSHHGGVAIWVSNVPP
jgi:hypothetical protein